MSLIIYFQFNNELLVNGFESNCVIFDIKNNPGSLSSDCQLYYLADVMKEKYHSQFIFILNLIRSDMSLLFDNISIELSEFNELNYLIMMKKFEYDSKKCSDNCKTECTSKQFFTEFSKIGYGQSSSQYD